MDAMTTRMRTSLVIALALVVSAVFGAVSSVAAADKSGKSREIMVTSLENQDPLVAGKTIRFTAHVQSDDPKNPTKTVKDVNDAIVYAFFTKGKESRQVSLVFSKKGLYEGEIKLPKPGTWKVNVMALAAAGDANSRGVGTMETTWEVKKAGLSPWMVGLIGVGVLILVLLIAYAVIRIRKNKPSGSRKPKGSATAAGKQKRKKPRKR